ncbi:hypothetical protein OUZ56_014297 [Daphnia magna]|uniref:Uncharacterized protein n=1 Tax=Daphnia magna TaxID=35525 RepID=A0ABR0AJB9_9CRUS|nr:hypothetical protein OUZ56_014297 [Daphnia magna]
MAAMHHPQSAVSSSSRLRRRNRQRAQICFTTAHSQSINCKTKKKNEEGGREEKDKKMDTLLIFVVAIVARGIDILWPLIDVVERCGLAHRVVTVDIVGLVY